MKDLTIYKEALNKLIEQKENIHYDFEELYSDIYNICVDIDNENLGDDLYLTDRIREYNFIDEELLGILIKEQWDVDTIIGQLIGLESNKDNFYIMDAYGHLTEVEKSDFEYLLDELIESLEEYIKKTKLENLYK
jgi:hypothetical protein